VQKTMIDHQTSVTVKSYLKQNKITKITSSYRWRFKTRTPYKANTVWFV